MGALLYTFPPNSSYSMTLQLTFWRISTSNHECTSVHLIFFNLLYTVTTQLTFWRILTFNHESTSLHSPRAHENTLNRAFSRRFAANFSKAATFTVYALTLHLTFQNISLTSTHHLTAHFAGKFPEESFHRAFRGKIPSIHPTQ